MDNYIYDDMALEQNLREHFGMKIEIDHVIARALPVGHTAQASVFLTSKKLLFVYIDGPTKLLLADVKKIISRMGLVPELYLPPKHQPNYFDDIGTEKFRDVFPGRSQPSDTDIAYYRTLAPYKPALVQVLEVKNAEIKQFDTDASSDWRVAAKFAYRRIRTS